MSGMDDVLPVLRGSCPSTRRRKGLDDTPRALLNAMEEVFASPADEPDVASVPLPLPRRPLERSNASERRASAQS